MKHPVPGGLLIAIEGIDGAGKTTLASALAQYCGERGLNCLFSKEPTGINLGHTLRRTAHEGRLSLQQEIELFTEDRRNHVERAIRPMLEENGVVILDRYYWSTAAYQGARGADPEDIIKLNEEFAPQPDLLLLLDLPAEVGVARILRRGDKPNKFEGVESMRQIRDIFLKISSAPYCRVIDGKLGIREMVRLGMMEFHRVAVNKIALGHGATPLGMEAVMQFFGSDSLSPELAEQLKNAA